MQNTYAPRTHEKMREVLMNAKTSGPAVHYHMIRGGKDKRNITVWEVGVLGGDKDSVGGEYIKSYGHYHVGELDETYEVLAGTGIVILQTRKIGDDGQPIDNEITKFEAHFVKPGDVVFIPSGVGHLAINTGDTWFVTSDDSPVDFGDRDPVSMPGHADYGPFKRLRGAAYYVIKGENGKPSFIKNPNYYIVPEVTII